MKFRGGDLGKGAHSAQRQSFLSSSKMEKSVLCVFFLPLCLAGLRTRLGELGQRRPRTDVPVGLDV